MYYEISASIKEGKQLTPTQRKSGFSECPRIGHTHLRRGVVMKCDEDYFKRNQVAIKRLYDSESINIYLVEDDGERHKLGTETTFKAKEQEPAVDLKPTPSEPVIIKVPDEKLPVAEVLTAPTEAPIPEPIVVKTDSPNANESGDFVLPKDEVKPQEPTPEVVLDAPKKKGKKGKKEEVA